jgi:hypothetical protein
MVKIMKTFAGKNALKDDKQIHEEIMLILKKAFSV